MAKKTIKKTSKKTRKKASGKTVKKTGKSIPDNFPILPGVPYRVLIKWGLVASVWGIIVLAVIIGWFAATLPALISAPQFERKASIIVKAEDGSVIGRYGELKGISVTVDELPPHLIQAVLATEDRRFYDHHGIDPFGIARAMVRNLGAGHYVQGGSTITQQLAKNLFLSHERTLKRKIQEALLALWLEHELTKDEILSAYLNRVYLGSGAYGVDAASRIYFSKSASEVNLREAAILAGLLKAPSRYSPESNPKLAQERANVVLGAMEDAGYISKEAMENEHRNTPVIADREAGGDSENYFTDWIVADIDNLVGPTESDIVVETTLDPTLQRAATIALSNYLDDQGATVNASQGAVIVMSLDGAVRAMVGGRNYRKSQFNRVTQAVRSPGSSFKPIVYLTALNAGWRKTDLIDDSPLKVGNYAPENYRSEYMGEVPLEIALARSLNTAAVRLAQYVGINNVIDTARMLGIKADLIPDLSLALGSSGVPMLEMATAFGTFATGGQRIAPYAITNISKSDDTPIYKNHITGPGGSIYNPHIIAELNSMMEGVIQYGTATAAKVPFYAAGKTGTSQDFRDAWFIGFTNSYVAAVWVGNDDNSPMKQVTGGSGPARIWREIMMSVPQDPNRTAFEDSVPPPSSVLPEEENKEEGDGFSGMIRRLFN